VPSGVGVRVPLLALTFLPKKICRLDFHEEQSEAALKLFYLEEEDRKPFF
jgi:hypothetical protein